MSISANFLFKGHLSNVYCISKAAFQVSNDEIDIHLLIIKTIRFSSIGEIIYSEYSPIANSQILRVNTFKFICSLYHFLETCLERNISDLYLAIPCKRFQRNTFAKYQILH